MIPGDRVGGRFEVEQWIGASGMGAVYRARDLEGGGLVAIKVLLSAGRLEEARFEREVEALAGLRHPGIVRYVAHGQTEGGAPWLAMEWLAGEDLAQRLARGRLDVDASLGLARRVAEALREAHQRGLVHRDLKPSNLFLEGGDPLRIKVLDFGVARAAEDPASLTRTGVILGTPAYMAPEQARGARSIDARVDVFALGCVLFECLVGHPPFTGESGLAVLGRGPLRGRAERRAPAPRRAPRGRRARRAPARKRARRAPRRRRRDGALDRRARGRSRRRGARAAGSHGADARRAARALRGARVERRLAEPDVDRVAALAAVARASVAQGRVDEAPSLAREITALRAELGPIQEFESFVALAQAEVFAAAGERALAASTIAAARARILTMAANARDLEQRNAFLSGIEEHASILALARELGVDR